MEECTHRTTKVHLRDERHTLDPSQVDDPSCQISELYDRTRPMKIAYSTVACPQSSLADAINAASKFGYLGLEMRTFHEQGSNQVVIGSDPREMEPASISQLFDDAGIVPVSLATSVKFDKPINPPVIGRMFLNEEAGVEDAKAYVDLADRAGIKFVRVYGYHLPAAEPRTWSMRRVSDRLKLAAQTCRNTDVRMQIENAGSFAHGSDLLGLLELVNSQWLGASFNVLASYQADEDPIEGLKLLKDQITCVKLTDIDHDGNPVLLGQGVLPVRQIVNALREMSYSGWIVYEHPALWRSDLAISADEALKHAADSLYEWIQTPASIC